MKAKINSHLSKDLKTYRLCMRRRLLPSMYDDQGTKHCRDYPSNLKE